MNRNDYRMTDALRDRYEQLYHDYSKLYTDPDGCSPKFILDLPAEYQPTFEEMLSDPDIMLKRELEALNPHIEAGDDRVPTVRVQFGTAVVANAFGCPMAFPENNLPCAAGHILKNPEDILSLKAPDQNAPIYRKVKEWTGYFRARLPEGYFVQMADVQGPFNNAHLLRGTEIFYDLYDNPELLDLLLDKVTRHTADYALWQKEWTGARDGWFFDWGALFRGNARISNCSLHMLGVDHYRTFVYRHDETFFRLTGGGRVHYCGTPDGIIEEMAKIDGVSGIDYDSTLHDIEKTVGSVPEHTVLFQEISVRSPLMQAMIRDGKWPFPRRNLIFSVKGLSSPAEGRELLTILKKL